MKETMEKPPAFRRVLHCCLKINGVKLQTLSPPVPPEPLGTIRTSHNSMVQGSNHLQVVLTGSPSSSLDSNDHNIEQTPISIFLRGLQSSLQHCRPNSQCSITSKATLQEKVMFLFLYHNFERINQTMITNFSMVWLMLFLELSLFYFFLCNVTFSIGD